ncbi:hypothetical protein EH165_06475 [Nakamurella antarctica]|uniref:Neutral zinc metallopeptidase n=1 Tax=Nakamurella antarctica TaxID=1902245 RepID=A0A3G8ZM42_9ACTN|nr:hypothetical protein [Nakamurella antarctica]AZI57847.1 hypothetical protein EH165_06475 [Nakamurella antarctica]
MTALVAVASLLFACTQYRQREPSSATSETSAALLDATLPPTVSRVAGSPDKNPGPDTALPSEVLAELVRYWTLVFPDAFGRQFTPLAGGIHPLDSQIADSNGPETGALCIITAAQIAGNAYYCPGTDGIVYDTAVLVPVLTTHYGRAGVISSFAHEFGHAVAARAKVATGAAINVEAQADCFAGNFLAWEASPEGADLAGSGAAFLSELAPLLDFRDQPDFSPATAGAHGLGIDRAQAVILGYRGTPVDCVEIANRGLVVALGKMKSALKTSPRFGDDASVVQAARTSAEQSGLFALTSAQWSTVAPSVADRKAAADLGQFGLATATVRAASALRFPRDAAAAGCAVGRWVAAIYGSAVPGTLGSWPTDVDEALDLMRLSDSASSAEVIGFVDGFARGCV